MKTKYNLRIVRIATLVLAATTTLDVKADGHDQIIPISDDGMLIIQIALVMLGIGIVFLLSGLLRSFIRKKNLPEPKSCLLIVVLTILIVWFWNWIARKINLFDVIPEIAITPIGIFILFLALILLYLISPKKKVKEN